VGLIPSHELGPRSLTLPILPEGFEAMRPYFCEAWGNPSIANKFGSKLKGVIGTARAQVTELIGA
jgi:cysteine desulfurase